MSTNNQRLNTGQQATIDTETAKVFGWNIRSTYDNYTNNSSYDPITLKAGTLMGRIAATDILVPFTSTANDGSQFPLGILAEDITLAGGSTAKIALIVAGDVIAEKILFVKPGDGLDIVVSTRRVKDHIGASTVGIKLIYGTTEMSGYDN